MAATTNTINGYVGNLLTIAVLNHRAQRLDDDIARMRAHCNDGTPAIRKHARDWLSRLKVERAVLHRWQGECATLATLFCLLVFVAGCAAVGGDFAEVSPGPDFSGLGAALAVEREFHGSAFGDLGWTLGR